MDYHRRRVIIASRGTAELFDILQACYVGDPAAQVILYRRGTPDRRQAVLKVPVERRGRQRRIVDSTAILRVRGFFATRMVCRRAGAVGSSAA